MKKNKEYYNNIAQFNKDSNKALKIVIDIINKFEGKQYGKATAQKIHKEIREATKHFNFWSIWLGTQHSNCLNIQHKDNHENIYYFDFLNPNNTIIKAEHTHELKPEFEPVQTVFALEKLKTQINEVAEKLLPLVEEYNKLLRQTKQEDTDTSTHRFSLYSIGKWGIR